MHELQVHSHVDCKIYDDDTDKMDSFVSSFSGICKYTECSDTYLPRNVPAIVKIIWIRTSIQHSPVMDWQPVRDAYCLSPCACWDGSQSSPSALLNWISRRKWMAAWIDGTSHRNTWIAEHSDDAIHPFISDAAVLTLLIYPLKLYWGDIAEFPSWDRVTISWVWFNISSLFEMPRTPHLRGCPKH